MWQIKRFKTHAAMVAWVERNEHKFQWVQVFIHNAYAVEYRKLRIIG